MGGATGLLLRHVVFVQALDGLHGTFLERIEHPARQDGHGVFSAVIGVEAGPEGFIVFVGRAPRHGCGERDLPVTDGHGDAHQGLGLQIAPQRDGQSAVAHVGDGRLARETGSIVEPNREVEGDPGKSSGVGFCR